MAEGPGQGTGTGGHPIGVCPVPSRLKCPGTRRDKNGTCPAVSRLWLPEMVWLTNRSGRSVLADDGEAIRLPLCNEAVAVAAAALGRRPCRRADRRGASRGCG